jgi:hypothetical protein
MITHKQREWEQTAARFYTATDKIGMNIDSGILETVIALNALGIETSASCEGHLDHGIAAPWIDIEAKSASEDVRRVAQIFTRADEAFERQNLPPADIEAMFAEAHREQKRVKTIHLEQRTKLMKYLAAFYATRQVPYDQIIAIHPRDTAGRARLESLGADLQLIVPPTMREQKLTEYQQEMQELTAFLKYIYFSA